MLVRTRLFLLRHRSLTTRYDDNEEENKKKELYIPITGAHVQDRDGDRARDRDKRRMTRHVRSILNSLCSLRDYADSDPTKMHVAELRDESGSLHIHDSPIGRSL
ncbi:hypothetical protein HZH68_004716 [Vespula germanica]|uniref:Uncharacterized protein n=1 Tax=Vespula germanica TaxID=30212 RepID=A0A834KPM6_VESGE|nr:hypothetical protein HZH68_004716 [Vespula germanica]